MSSVILTPSPMYILSSFMNDKYWLKRVRESRRGKRIESGIARQSESAEENPLNGMNSVNGMKNEAGEKGRNFGYLGAKIGFFVNTLSKKCARARARSLYI